MKLFIRFEEKDIARRMWDRPVFPEKRATTRPGKPWRLLSFYLGWEGSR